MELIYPSYYKEFVCIADRCPDSCCHEWEVQVDGETAARYRAMEGSLGDALREALYDENGETYMRNYGERCPMWRDDGLCRIQDALGHEALCRVCQQFPRLRQDYGDFAELGLEMSCPEAARMMLSGESWHLVTETAAGGEEPDYDPEIMAILRRSRPAAFALLRDRTVPVNLRLARLLVYGHHVQGIIDGGEALPFDAEQTETLLERCAGQGNAVILAEFYRDLEILTERWRCLLARMGEKPVWSEELCRLAEYQVYRYFYQAVSDWDLAARMKMIAAGCVLLAHLPGAVRENIQLYAKEIENDAENVDALLDGAFTERALTDVNLLGLLAPNG